MSTYMKTNALNTAFQLLKVIASGKLLQEQITEAEAELHIHFDQKQLLTANSALLDLLEKIKAETAHKLKNDTDLLNSYFRKITIAQKDYENVSLFLFLTEHPAEHLDYPDFASYVDFLLNLTEARRCQLFLTMIKRYNHMYLRDTDSDEQTDNVSSEKNISTLDVVAAIMEMDVPMEIRWKIQDIFVHWKSHLEKALPLLNYAYQTLIDFEPQLELYAQNFISYWTNEITNQGGIVPFAEHLFPLNNLPDNPFGYKLYISFFLPFELGFHADLSAENKVLSSPYEIVLGILYKKNGILAGIANIGYLAVLLIIVRYTNVILTIEGIFGILISIVLNYIFTIRLLKTMKTEEDTKKAYNNTAKSMVFILIPALVIAIALCFAGWMPIYSFGALMFWGLLTIFIYNTVITRTLMVISTKK